MADAARAAGLDVVGVAALERRLGRTVWELRAGEQAVLVDSRTGRVLPQLTASEAGDLAGQRFLEPAPVREVTRIEKASGEYRGGAVPAWRVDLAAAGSPSLYVDAVTGEVQAVRTGVWRRYDFLWMLHIMNYEDREDFSHPLLTVAASLGLLTALSGLGVAWLVYRPRRRRRAA